MRVAIAIIISMLMFSGGLFVAFDVLDVFAGKESYSKWAGRICCGVSLWLWIVLL
jgi:hypothetical protein